MNSPTNLKIAPLLGAIGLVLFLPGCQREDPPPEPTAPWRADAKKTEETKVAAIRAQFQLAPGQTVSFEAHPKRGTTPGPEGTVRAVSGAISLSPAELQYLKGTLVFELGSLRILDGGVEDGARSAEARRWLGLGGDVPSAERDRIARAEFRIHSAKQLSIQGATRGQVLKGADGQPTNIRRVNATLVGDLLLRQVEVRHEIRVQLDFTFEGAVTRTATPTRVVIRLLSPDRIPLDEHGIVPRTEAGLARTGALALIGQEVDSAVRVTGELAFDAAQK